MGGEDRGTSMLGSHNSRLLWVSENHHFGSWGSCVEIQFQILTSQRILPVVEDLKIWVVLKRFPTNPIVGWGFLCYRTGVQVLDNTMLHRPPCPPNIITNTPTADGCSYILYVVLSSGTTGSAMPVQ